MLLAGLDIGTTGCKLSVYHTDGTRLGSIYREYPALRGHGVHEIDAAAIWEAVQAVIAEATQTYPGIAGLGVTSFGETFVLLDENDTPILPSMLYTDPRGAEQCDQLCERIDRRTLIEITGLSPHSMYSLPKLMWTKQHRPDALAQAKHIMLMED